MTLLAHKETTGRFTGMFVGDDAGAWEYWPSIHLGRSALGWTWEGVLGMSRKNDWRNLSMEGATEHHRGLLKALPEMVAAYPELNDFVLDFDGKQVAVPDLLRGGSRSGGIDWKRLTLFHGTSSAAVSSIREHGLRPRGSGRAIYGTTAGAAEGRSDAIYLTTQPGTAHFAAYEAAKMLGGKPTVLAVTGLSGENMAPDEDSHERTAEASLERLGSVAYVGKIAPSYIKVHSAIGDDGEWHEAVGGSGKRRHGKERSILALAKDVRRRMR